MTTANTETVNAAPVRSGAWLGAVQIRACRRSHEKLGLVGVGGDSKAKREAQTL